MTSGAMYSMEPHTVKSRWSLGARLARPKSTSITAPDETKTTLSALGRVRGRVRVRVRDRVIGRRCPP